MRTVLRSAVLGCLAFLGIGSVAVRPAGADAEEKRLGVEFEDGAQAPEYGWSQDDGCPARTGASQARALRGVLERAWKAPAKEGSIEGEPLAWKDRVFVVERAGKRRVVRVLSAATGLEKSRWVVESPLPTLPCVGDSRLVLRTSPTVVEGLAVGDTMIARRWRAVAKEGIGPATMLRDEIYLVRDGVLERWAYGGAQPVWPKAPDAPDAVRVEKVAGADGVVARYPRPSLRGGSVFVTTGHEVVEVDRATGAVRGRAAFEGDVDPDASRLVVAASDVFVRRGTPASAGTPDTVRFGRSSPGTLESRSALSLASGLAAVGPTWIGVVEAEGKRCLCGGRGGAADGEGSYVFAGGGLHDEFVTAVAPTYVPGVVYVGLKAFAVPSLNLLRVSSPPTLSRSVPVRDRLLVVESATMLSAWREARPADERLLVKPPGLPAGATASVSLKACKAALDDGRVLEGPFSFDPKANVLRSSKSGEPASMPARSVQAILSNEPPRQLLWALRAADAAAGVASIVKAETGKAYLALVPAAIAASDPDLAHRALAGALEAGAPDAEVAAADASIATLAAGPHARVEVKAVEVETQLSALSRREADVLVTVAEGMPKGPATEVAAGLVRAAVERDPSHEAATRWVKARLPKELRLAEPLRLTEWLDFIAVRNRLDVRLWGVNDTTKEPWGSDGYRPPDDSRLFSDFWAARAVWPGTVELVAFECGPLVVFSPLERPGAIVQCLALGRLVADTLDKTYSPIGPPRKDDERLILHLYSNRAQYLEQSRPTGEAERGDGLEHTAGHYSPSDNVTRMFFPDDEDQDLSVQRVYSHELTHHWIERRRPTRQGAKPGDDSDASTPCYWVVEGFADFVMGFAFDVDAQRASPENPRAEYSDCLSCIAPESLIPWDKLLTMPQSEFAKLSVADRIEQPRRWRLGPPGSTVPKVLFYDQASATCAYLYLAEGQKHRKALLEIVYAYYEGKATPDAVQKATGLSPEELGKRVIAWCKEQVKKG